MRSHPLGVELEVLVRREDAERFVEEVRGDDPDLARYLRIEEREFEAGGVNYARCGGSERAGRNALFDQQPMCRLEGRRPRSHVNQPS